MDALVTAFTPHLLELIAAIATLIIGWLAAKARARWGIEIEARQREALHSALMTGVRYALARGLQEQDAITKATVDYVQTSVPDALSALGPAPQQLIEMAEATLEERRRPEISLPLQFAPAVPCSCCRSAAPASAERFETSEKNTDVQR